MDAYTRDIAVLRRLASRKWQRYAEDVLPCWIADMDFPVAAPIAEFLARSVQNSDLGYPRDLGDDPLPEVFAERARQRYGWRPEPGRVEIIADVVQGLYLGLQVYCEAGEGAIIQTPIYPPFLIAAAETGRPAILNPLVRGPQGYEIDFDALRDAVDARTRVLMLCNPHNPTGRVFRRDELERLAALVLEHDLVVLADEIHADLIFDSRRHIAFASLGPEIEARTVTFNSATKAFNTAGLRCAVAAFGSDSLKARFDSVPRRARGGMGALVTEVTRIAWEECSGWLEDTLRYLEANRDYLSDFLRARMPGMDYVPPESTYLAWLDCRGLGLDEEAYTFFLREARVALMEGPQFGPQGRGCTRLNFATPRHLLTEILERMAAAIERA